MVFRVSWASVLLLLALLATAAADTRGATALRSVEPPDAAFSAAHALVIGIDAYSNGWTPLRNAVADAEAVAEALAATGFDSVRLVRDPDRSRLEAELEAFAFGPAADPAARVLIWFAGHGHTIDGTGYLVPPEAPLPGHDPATDAEFRRVALSMPQFDSRYLREMRARHVLAVFDACFAGTIFSATRAAVTPPSIRFAAGNRVMMLITSGQEGEEVRDDGMFRRVFVDALTGADPRPLTEDGYLLGSRLAAHLAQRVADYSGGFQHPAYGTVSRYQMDRGDFLFPVRFVPGQPGPPASVVNRPPPESRQEGTAVAPAVPPQPVERRALLVSPAVVQPDDSVLGAPMARLATGSQVTVLGEAAGNWWRVRLRDGREGYLSRATSLRWIGN